MQKIQVEGLEIEVDLLPDGTLEVYRNGEFRGMLMVVEPEPVATIAVHPKPIHQEVAAGHEAP